MPTKLKKTNRRTRRNRRNRRTRRTRRNRAGMDDGLGNLTELFRKSFSLKHTSKASKKLGNLGTRKSTRTRKPSEKALVNAKREKEEEQKRKANKMKADNKKKRNKIFKKKRGAFDFSDLSKALDDISK